MTENEARLTPAEKWERATLANDFIFYKVMRHNPEECRQILELLLGISIERIEMTGEETIDVEPDAKAVRLDVYAKEAGDTEPRAFDIEVQVADTKELPERARYYQGIMDVDMLKSGDRYSALKTSYVIFLCMSDPIIPADEAGRRKKCYTFETRCVEDPDIALKDRMYKHFFIVPECAKMMQDRERKAFFSLFIPGMEGTAGTALTDRLKKLVEDAKQNMQWRKQYMTWERQRAYDYQDGLEAGIARGEARGVAIGEKRGERNARLDNARRMLAEGISVEQTARIVQLPLEEVRRLAADVVKQA